MDGPYRCGLYEGRDLDERGLDEAEYSSIGWGGSQGSCNSWPGYMLKCIKNDDVMEMFGAGHSFSCYVAAALRTITHTG